MLREIDLAFIKLHVLYHAGKAEIYGLGIIEELASHGYRLSPGTLYPTLAKMEKGGLLVSEARIVNHKQRKYYRITPVGKHYLAMAKAKVRELYREVVEEK